MLSETAYAPPPTPIGVGTIGAECAGRVLGVVDLSTMCPPSQPFQFASFSFFFRPFFTFYLRLTVPRPGGLKFIRSKSNRLPFPIQETLQEHGIVFRPVLTFFTLYGFITELIPAGF